MTRRLLPAPLEALTPSGVFLPAGSGVPASRLAGAMVVSEEKGLERLESIHPQISSVTSMRWAHTCRVATALLADGAMAVLLLGNSDGPVLDVLALEISSDGSHALADTMAFTSMFGRLVARRASRGQLLVAEGDLTWLCANLNPQSRKYYRNFPTSDD